MQISFVRSCKLILLRRNPCADASAQKLVRCAIFWAGIFDSNDVSLMLLNQNLIFRFRFSFVFRNFCVRRGEGRRHGGAARPARPLGPGRALAATNAKIEKRGGQASERPGVRTPGRPGVRASGRPDFRTFWHPDGTSEPTFVGANISETPLIGGHGRRCGCGRGYCCGRGGSRVHVCGRVRVCQLP